MKPRLLASPLCALLCVLLALNARAEDLGVIGPLHEIREQNAIEMIKEKLLAKQKSGELAQWEADAKKRVLNSINNPKPVPGMSTSESAKTFYYDPTFRVAQNIVDHEGRILIPAGYKKNPLEVFSMSKHWLFFDATDKRQVLLAQELINRYEGRVKPILVAGSYMDLMKRWKLPVFFDQHGYLTTRFGITNVPALVSQEGLLLRIDVLRIKG